MKYSKTVSSSRRKSRKVGGPKMQSAFAKGSTVFNAAILPAVEEASNSSWISWRSSVPSQRAASGLGRKPWLRDLF